MCRKYHLSCIKSFVQHVILVKCHWFVWLKLNQPLTLWLKIEHISKQSECFHILAWLKLRQHTENSHKNWWPKLLHMPPSEDGLINFVLRTRTKLKKASNEEKLSAVTESVKADPHICMWEIFSELAFSLDTVHKIPHGILHMRKLAAV